MADSARQPPDVAVIIPAHNEEGSIAAALASVARQAGPDRRLEAVVVVNGATDATAAVVRDWIAAHPVLPVCLIEDPVAGLARAKNRGARAARGRWLIFLDADSRLGPGLARRVTQIGMEGCPAGSIRVIADSSDLLDHAFFALMEFGKELFGLHAQMFYCERALFLRLGGFREDLMLAEDQEFLTRVARDGARLCRVKKSWIATSPRRLRRLPLRLGMATMLLRWALANWGIGRRWRY